MSVYRFYDEFCLLRYNSAVRLKSADIPEEHAAFFFRIEEAWGVASNLILVSFLY
jgi:hypothetical protein